MILWDRVKKSFDEGVDIVARVSRRLSERAHIEAAVARLMIDRGSLDTKVNRLNQRLGSRVYDMWEQKDAGVMKDREVLEAIRDIHNLKEQIEVIQQDIKRVSLGEEGH